MRWLLCLVVFAGCLRARATVVHPTGLERTQTAAPGSVIAREAPHAREVSQPPADTAGTNLGSIELGALIPFDATRIHLAPGVRIFNGNSVLWGVAVGAELGRNRRGPGLAVEGSVHVGNGPANEANTILQAMDFFAGVTMRSGRGASSIAIGPSIGILGMPGGDAAVMLGLGLRVTSRPQVRP